MATGIPHDPVFFQLLGTALQKANPTGLPSNLVLQQFSMPTDTVGVAETVTITTIAAGYPYASGVWVPMLAPGEAPVTAAYGAAWVLRAEAAIEPGGSLGLSVAVGSGPVMTLTALDPGAVVTLADVWPWSDAADRGGISTYGAPSGWPDPAAHWIGLPGASGDPTPGCWLLRKQIQVPQQGNVTLSVTAVDGAAVWVDGVRWAVAASGAITTVTQSVTAGAHEVVVTGIALGTGSSVSQVLLSFAAADGTILEDGATSPAVGSSWRTAGLVSATWGPLAGPLDTVATNPAQGVQATWYVIPASAITGHDATLTVSASGAAALYGVWWTSVPPWRWNEGGEYDIGALPQPPSETPPKAVTVITG